MPEMNAKEGDSYRRSNDGSEEDGFNRGDSDSDEKPTTTGVRNRKFIRRCSPKAEDRRDKNEKSRSDRPTHRPRDSLLSLTSKFQNFEGVFNWGILLLLMGGIRLSLENLNKYGIRVNPKVWIGALIGNSSTETQMEYPFLYLMTSLQVLILFIFMTEKLMAKRYVSRQLGYTIQLFHLAFMFAVPCIMIKLKYGLIGPIRGIVATMSFAIMFLKMWSYIQVNYWCYSDSIINYGESGIDLIRKMSSSSSENEMGKTLSMIESKKMKPKLSVKENKPIYVDPIKVVQYPDNLNLKDLTYFVYAPSLCYELNYPRTDRIRKTFLLRRLLEIIVCTNVVFALIQQWMIPSVVNSLIPFTNMEIGTAMERLLKLALPNHLIWLIWFYLIFHSVFNTLGEILRFADRQFYKDWWNAPNIKTFWVTWNVPVHRWCVRHLYKPVIQLGCSVSTAKILVFLFSAVFHEYFVSVPLGLAKPYTFFGMLSQIPLLPFSEMIEKRFGSRYGNMVVWLSLILGQPMAILMYYHDFVVEHYGEKLLDSFGRL